MHYFIFLKKFFPKSIFVHPNRRAGRRQVLATGRRCVTLALMPKDSRTADPERPAYMAMTAKLCTSYRTSQIVASVCTGVTHLLVRQYGRRTSRSILPSGPNTAPDTLTN